MAKVTIGGRSYEVAVHGDAVVVDGQSFPIKVRNEQGFALVNAGGVSYRVMLPGAGARESGMAIEVDYRPFTVEWDGRFGSGPAPRAPRASGEGAGSVQRASVKGGVTSQIAGRIISIKVAVGATVNRGDVLLTLEAMKMENEIKSPSDGTVKEILVAEGARVAEGETLVVIE
jgi:biotin carboxyl carrier protein